MVKVYCGSCGRLKEVLLSWYTVNWIVDGDAELLRKRASSGY
jgi:hypothetical protein